MEIDIRPIRKDGKQLPVRRSDAEYDRSATRKLVLEIWQTGMAKGVAFNDLSIPRVHRVAGHDDHLHVEIIA